MDVIGYLCWNHPEFLADLAGVMNPGGQEETVTVDKRAEPYASAGLSISR